MPPFDDQRDFDWSPDSRPSRILTVGARNFQNVEVVPAAGGADARPVSFLANSVRRLARRGAPTARSCCSARASAPSRGGRARRSGAAHAEVPRGSVPRSVQGGDAEDDARRRPPRRPRARHPTARSPAESRAKRPRRGREGRAETDRDRLRRHPRCAPARCRSASTSAQSAISPDGKWLLLTATAAGQQNLYVYSLDELSKEPAVARQLTSTPGPKRQRAVHAPTARRSSTSIADACTTSRSRSASRRRSR